jgi:hypothetical protein
MTSLRQIEASGGPPLKGTREISSLCEQHSRFTPRITMRPTYSGLPSLDTRRRGRQCRHWTAAAAFRERSDFPALPMGAAQKSALLHLLRQVYPPRF